ncbi:hypothetical protein K3495_g11740 [Podosphaera aphanis]|nr:hypothetical protein K3495_g11740 [Podosphaera aphanis]
MHIPRLSTWRDHKAVDSTERPVSLHAMMPSLRDATVAEFNKRSHNSSAHATSERPVDPDAICKKYAHKHFNKQGHKQNPDLAHAIFCDKWRYGKLQKEVKGKGEAAAEFGGRGDEEEDEECFKSSLDLIYDK